MKMPSDFWQRFYAKSLLVTETIATMPRLELLAAELVAEMSVSVGEGFALARTHRLGLSTEQSGAGTKNRRGNMHEKQWTGWGSSFQAHAHMQGRGLPAGGVDLETKKSTCQNLHNGSHDQSIVLRTTNKSEQQKRAGWPTWWRRRQRKLVANQELYHPASTEAMWGVKQHRKTHKPRGPRAMLWCESLRIRVQVETVWHKLTQKPGIGL